MILIDNEGYTDPSWNLAIEEYALRHLDQNHSFLLIYINTPSVIIGRNQNVFEEINLKYIRERGIPVLRRISGGGAVYHDRGNVNFSFITDYDYKKLNNYVIFNTPIIKALNELGIDAYMDERNAIRIQKDDRKISGNAQFSTSGRMFSHGTLLFDSDLEAVEKSLNAESYIIASRAHKSVQSAVSNISEYLGQSLNTEEFKDYLINRLLQSDSPDVNTYRFSGAQWKEIEELRTRRYKDWMWNYGKSPRFSMHNSKSLELGNIEMDIQVKKGKIQNLTLHSDVINTPLLHEIERRLENSLYKYEDIRKKLKELNISNMEEDLSLHLLLELIYGS